MLFNNTVFGPILSRRLGISLGVNLLPINFKLCNFNCIYCECGWTHFATIDKGQLPTKDDVLQLLNLKLADMVSNSEKLDSITFAGNGEPTLHPEFPAIIDGVVALRNKYYPSSKITVLSNATMCGRSDIKAALMKVDNNILKLDAVDNTLFQSINRPTASLDVATIIDSLLGYSGNLIIQSLFLRGKIANEIIDNTVEPAISEWLAIVEKIKPQEVMIYTIDRDTPNGTDLKKVSINELQSIANRVNLLGIPTQIAG